MDKNPQHNSKPTPKAYEEQEASRLDLLECLPCPAYLIKNDADFTLEGANSKFFELIGCTKEEMAHRFGNRWGALLDEASLKELSLWMSQQKIDSSKQKTFQTKQHLSRNGVDTWIQTNIVDTTDSSGSFLFCVSTDISTDEKSLQHTTTHSEALQVALSQAGMDCFEYNLATGTAHLYETNAILPASLGNKQGSCTNFINRTIAEGLVCADSEDTFRDAFSNVADSAGKVTVDIRMHAHDNTTPWMRLSLAPSTYNTSSNHVIGTLKNVTQEKETAHDYLNETQFYHALLSEKEAFGQVDVTDNRITRAGGIWNLYNEIIDKVTYNQLINEFIEKVVHPEDRSLYRELMQRDNLIESLDNGIDRLGCDFRRIVDQNKMVWMHIDVHLFKDPLSNHVLALLSLTNIDSKKRSEIMLLHESTVDPVTNTFNRHMTERSIVDYLRGVGEKENCALIIIDIDNFKNINEDYGHKAGDRILAGVANALGTTFRKSDIIGRFGGDEFIVFLKDVKEPTWVGERLESLFTTLSSFGDVEALTCSVGIARSTGPSTYEALFQQADIALYAAKREGKGRFIHYEDTSVLSEDRRLAHASFTSPSSSIQGGPRGLLQDYGFTPNTEGVVNFDTFVAEQGDIAYLVDVDNYELICANQAFYDRLGLTEAQCMGMKCYEAMHKRSTPCPFCGRANWSTDKFYIWKNYNISLEQEFLIKNKLVSWRDKQVMLALAVDISNNKSIVDSLENGAMETHSILSGVQHMSEAKTLKQAMDSALENIGFFFQADNVKLWRKQENNLYVPVYSWTKELQKFALESSAEAVSSWITEHLSEKPMTLESPEAMLCYSYELHQNMKENGIKNQRWLPIRDGGEEFGCLSIDNISANFQNRAFLESFSVFVAIELRVRNLMEETLWAAMHDDLTGLSNRRSFEEFLANYRPDSVRCVGSVTANINNLKGINASRGFQTGNYYIKTFSDMLRDAFSDYRIFRLNGDEILIIALDISRTDLEERVNKLEQLIRDYGYFTVSFGHAWDDVEKDLTVLTDQSLEAMRVNKKIHHDNAPASEDIEHRKMLSGLVEAIEAGQFKVFLQPKVELISGKVMGAEALIRFHHADLGIIPPAKFIDALEKSNLIRYIDLFVLEETCKQLEQWKQQGKDLPIISLNFSRLTLLEHNIVTSVENIVSQYDVARANIEIEITESVACIGKGVLHQTAQELHAAGISLSLDDFGTKYTNLSILADLDVDTLKLDRSLVWALEDRMSYHAIVKNVINMCKDLVIDTIAEGVETQEQEDILRKLQCSFGQGYLYGKPMPITEFEHLFLND